MKEREKVGIAISHTLKAFIFVMGIWSAYKQDWLWSVACFFAFLLAIGPLFIKRSYHISLPWITELLIAFALSLHVWGGVLHFYSIPYYDKIAHFMVSSIVAFFALVIIYLLDVYWEGLSMDLFMIGFFIVIFTIAIGTLWEVGEFFSDQIFVGAPKAQLGLNDTMMDLVYDGLAGVIVGIVGTMVIRKGELKDIIHPLGKEVKKLGSKKFLQAKEKAMEVLEKAVVNGEVDRKALSILEKLNEIEYFFTTSSCSGRIVVLELPSIGDKLNAKFLGKWDRKINVNDVMDSLEKSDRGEIWFLAQPPIFHVSATDIGMASDLVKVAKQSGFKNSGVKSIGSKVAVEICSTEELDVPLGINGNILCGEDYLALIVSMANEIMEKAEKKLALLEENISKKF